MFGHKRDESRRKESTVLQEMKGAFVRSRVLIFRMQCFFHRFEKLTYIKELHWKVVGGCGCNPRDIQRGSASIVLQ